MQQLNYHAGALRLAADPRSRPGVRTRFTLTQVGFRTPEPGSSMPSLSSRVLRPVFVLTAVALGLAGCRGRTAAPPVATPALTIDRTSAALGSPIELHYHFTVAPGARFDQNYRVMVHFVNADEELMWTDDHFPPLPTTQWKPGQQIDYRRTLFLPVYPYVGEAYVEVGLYSPTTQKRLTLKGEDIGQRAYRVARLDILPQTANLPLQYTDGWHQAELAQHDPNTQWRWTMKSGTITFPNPKRDSTFYLQLDNPSGAFDQPQHVTVSVNGQSVLQFDLPPKQELLQKIPLTAAQLGTAGTGTITIAVDKTFIPADIPALHSTDPRELGVRVFRAFLLPG